MIPREELLAAYPLESVLTKQGREVGQASAKGERLCRCLFHGPDNHPSMSINSAKQIWTCPVCHIGGSVIDLFMRQWGTSRKDTMRRMAADAGIKEKTGVVETYRYADEHDRTTQFVDRIEDGDGKKFAQYTTDEAGQRHNGIAGVQRVLYRLERWASKDEVNIAEGEGKVHALESLGMDATCNAGGSGAWTDAYAFYLKGKHVNIWPDNDAPGDKWRMAVLKSLEGKVASLRTIRVPQPYNDVADLVIAQGVDMAAETTLALMEKIARIDRGVDLPLLSADECYELYRKHIASIAADGIDLGRWLPSFRAWSRILMPGDMAVVLADTGVGKTAVLANIAYTLQAPTIFWELELSSDALTERFIARDHGIETLRVETATKNGERFDVSKWRHVYTCPLSRVTIEDMETIIAKAELKMGTKPRLILVDYIGLMSGGSGKRYERLSTIAEGFKVLAKQTGTVVIIASQVSRNPERKEMDLHAAKDSGSIENSAQLVIGCWRPSVTTIDLKILKNTKVAGVRTIHCYFDGDRQTIRELTKEET